MELDFELQRSTIRGFYCSNKLWYELKKKTRDVIAVSSFMKQAIVEKMIREDPKNKEYYQSLL